MGFSIGPVTMPGSQSPKGMAPQGFMMGRSSPIIDPMDYETEEEYLEALKRQQAESNDFFSGGMRPPGYFMGSSGYAPEAWVPPEQRVERKPRWNQNIRKGPSRPPSGSGITK